MNENFSKKGTATITAYGKQTQNKDDGGFRGTQKCDGQDYC